MKAILNDAASLAVTNIVARVRAFKPDAAKSGSIAVNAIVSVFAESATQPQLEAFAERLVSPRARRKSLLKLLSECAANDDPEAFQTLEKVARKLQQKQKSEPKTAPNS